MFSTFLNVIVYVSILSCTGSPIRNGNRKTNPGTNDVGPQVKRVSYPS